MIVFLKCFTHTLGTGWYNNNSYRKAWRINPGISGSARKTAAYEKYSKEDWAVVLESWRWSLRSSFTPGRREVILEAQFYTRQGGGGPWVPVLHQASGTNMVQVDNGC